MQSMFFPIKIAASQASGNVRQRLHMRCWTFDVHYLLAKLYTKIPLAGWQTDILGPKWPLNI
jgi:hypothetical protein